MLLKRWLVGLPLKTAQASDERLSKTLALAIFSSNAISSVAYATEEILLILILAGTPVLAWSIPVSLAIFGWLAILTVSYRQIIYEYPKGAAPTPSADRILESGPGVDCSVSPDDRLCLDCGGQRGSRHGRRHLRHSLLVPYRESLCSGHHLYCLVVNLRGVRESGQIFASLPIFIGALGVMSSWLEPPRLCWATARQLPCRKSPRPEVLPYGRPDFFLCSVIRRRLRGLTGVEVISNGVSTFRRPESKCRLYHGTHGDHPCPSSSVSARWPTISASSRRRMKPWSPNSTRAIFGTGPLYYLIQGPTMVHFDPGREQQPLTGSPIWHPSLPGMDICRTRCPALGTGWFFRTEP